MQIGGFQKVSLIDYPKQITSIVFTQGCNFRCPYCHNPELVYPEQFKQVFDDGDVLRSLIKRKDKVDHVVITGGEPTIQEDLVQFIYTLKANGFFVKLDTNGSNTHILNLLIKNQLLDFIAMDIKGSRRVYDQIWNREGFNKTILGSIRVIKDSRIPYEFRTTFDKTLLTNDDVTSLKEQYPEIEIRECLKNTFP